MKKMALVLLFLPLLAAADREAVLKQIDVPHSYYYREMYLPQLTTGPSSVAWSPDGKSLVFSMQGSLWTQNLKLLLILSFRLSRLTKRLQELSGPITPYGILSLSYLFEFGSRFIQLA